MAGEEEVRETSNPPSPGYGGQAAESISSFIPHPSSFRRFVWRAVAIIIGGLFVYAGAVKVIDPAEFARDIDNYKMLPWQVSVSLGLYLPWLEIFCGLALIARVLHRGSVLILTALMVLFIVITIVAKARGLDISCGCFGHASKYLSFAWHLALDFVLLAALVLLFVRQRSTSRVAG